jgi:hypothetical protein
MLCKVNNVKMSLLLETKALILSFINLHIICIYVCIFIYTCISVSWSDFRQDIKVLINSIL